MQRCTATGHVPHSTQSFAYKFYAVRRGVRTDAESSRHNAGGSHFANGSRDSKWIAGHRQVVVWVRLAVAAGLRLMIRTNR